MWIACVDGFFSTVKDLKEPGRMLIRARCEKDIKNLYERYRDKCPSMVKPTSDETRDYRWRLSISKRDWVKLAAELASEVKYYFANWGRGDSDATNGEDRSFYAQSVMTSGTLDINQIPAHSQDAVFTTVQDEGVQQTWALQDQTVQLTLDGLFTWQWNVNFSEPLLSFRLDGSWGVF